MSHRNLIKYYGACRHETTVYLVMELLTGGDLSTVLARREVELSWRRRLLVAKDALEAISYLHEHDLIHRDIKTENILVDDNWRCVVCDYGFARRKQTSKAMTICGTDEWMAPEVIFGEVYDEKAVRPVPATRAVRVCARPDVTCWFVPSVPPPTGCIQLRVGTG